MENSVRHKLNQIFSPSPVVSTVAKCARCSNNEEQRDEHEAQLNVHAHCTIMLLHAMKELSDAQLCIQQYPTKVFRLGTKNDTPLW